MGLPKAILIFAYSVVMSSTRWAPPHISAQSATVARSTTRASAGHAAPLAPISASAGTVASLKVTSQSLRVGQVRVEHEELGAAQDEPALGLSGRARDAGGVPAGARLGPGERRLGPAQRDSCEPLFLLRRRAGLADREAAEQRGGEERPGHHHPAHLFHQHREVDEPEARAAEFLSVDQAQPPLLGQLGPELVGHARGLFHPGPHERRGALVLEELPRGGAEQLLLRAEAEIHGASPWAGRAAARQ